MMVDGTPRPLENRGEAPRQQYGALCWRRGDAGIEVLLVTSRDTGRWVIPKGWPMKDLDPAHSAAREAWEEAGVEGKPTGRPIGDYSYDKNLGRSDAPGETVPCQVEVFPLWVEKLANRFPEMRQRRRKWFSPAKAARKVAEPGLKRLLARLEGLADLPALP